MAVWYLMKGRWTPLEEIDHQLALKVGKIITSVGNKGLKQLKKSRKAYREEIFAALQDRPSLCARSQQKIRPPNLKQDKEREGF